MNDARHAHGAAGHDRHAAGKHDRDEHAFDEHAIDAHAHEDARTAQRPIKGRGAASFVTGRYEKTVRRGESMKADYILYYRPNVPLAVVEAKDGNHGVGDGMQQAVKYAEILDISLSTRRAAFTRFRTSRASSARRIASCLAVVMTSRWRSSNARDHCCSQAP